MLPVLPFEVVEFLNSEDPLHEWSVGERVFCHHCEGSFLAEGVRIYEEAGQVYVGCPTKGCDGHPHDWAKEAWWD